MSSIEKAMKKLDRHPEKKGAESTKPFLEPESATETKEKSSRSINIDLAYLNKLGMVTPLQASNQIAEEYRIIKQPLLKNINKSVGEDHKNLIMITSSVPGEGKTFTSINLAMSMAMELERTVLLVDADASQTGISKSLGFNPGIGLVDVLLDNSTNLSDVLIKTNVEKLTLLSAGRPYSNMAELLASESMAKLVDELARRYHDRIIIFDSPPLLVSSESRLLANLMGQLLVVIEANKTPQSLVQESLGYLDSSKIIGLVLNKSQRTVTSYYGYGYGYGYGSRQE